MRRIFVMALALSALVLALPSMAAAAHHGKHHARHSKRHHHAAGAKLLQFGAPLGSGAPQGAAAPGKLGTAPTTPTPGETAGTVTSFTEGVLTITLNDKSTVSGKVTEQTQILCHPATPVGSDDENEEGDDESAATPSSGPSGGDSRARSASSDGGSGDGGSGEDAGGGNCTTAALVAGAVVREAELSIGGTGAVWTSIDLIQ